MKPTFFKNILWVILFSVITFAGIQALGKFQQFRASFKNFDNVNFGHSRAEVIYRLGNPNEVLEALETEKSFKKRFKRVFLVDGPPGDVNLIPKGKVVED